MSANSRILGCPVPQDLSGDQNAGLDFALSSPNQDADVELLQRVQEYLRLMRDRILPRPELAQQWKRFHGVYDPLIQQVARAGSNAGIDPSDAAQEAWVAILLYLPRFKFDPARGCFRGWLIKVVQHSLIRLARQRRRLVPLERTLRRSFLRTE